MDSAIIEYIARESVRRYGEVEPRMPDLLRRNIRRRFKRSVPRNELVRIISHYKQVYTVAASVLRGYQEAPPGQYLGSPDLLLKDFLAELVARYPGEPLPILQIVANYAIYYEYER
jgi:hypothetical protein